MHLVPSMAFSNKFQLFPILTIIIAPELKSAYPKSNEVTYHVKIDWSKIKIDYWRWKFLIWWGQKHSQLIRLQETWSISQIRLDESIWFLACRYTLKILGFLNQLHFKSIWVTQHKFLLADIEWRNVKGDSKTVRHKSV